MDTSKDSRHRLGRFAEQWVAQWLEDQDWQILGRNLRTPYAEVDLLALPPNGEALVLVEVKARAPLAWSDLEEALQGTQRQRLARALEYLALRLDWLGAVRADLVGVEARGQYVFRAEHRKGIDLYDR